MRPSPFQRFVIASGFTNLADGIALVAWGWLASLLTRDPLLIALVLVALRLPWAVCAVPAGIITDRSDRRRLIIAMDALRALGFAVAAAALWGTLPLDDAPATGIAHPALFITLMSAALIVGTAEVFRDNAAQTILPSIVPHDTLERANGRLWSVELIGNILIGPALGAALLGLFLPLPFLVNATAYGLAIVLVLRIPGQFRPAQSGSGNWRQEFRAGYTFLRDAPLLRSLALITGFWNLVFHMMSLALLLHVQENLGLGATAYGLILAAGALGGIAGSLAAEHVIARFGPGRTAQLMLIATGPMFFAIAAAPNAVLLALALAVFEFTGLVWNTVSVSYRQRVIPDALLGRVNSLYRLLAWGMIPLGMLLSGLAIRAVEGPLDRGTALLSPIVLAGLGALLLGVIGWRALGIGFRDAVATKS